jgi:ATP-dependent DNA helicase RecG
MVSSTDGFVIAEKDLELRGPGEFFGTEQAGLPAFRFANLITDQHILKKAKLDAFEIIENDPDLQAEEHRVLKDLIKGELHEREELIMY